MYQVVKRNGKLVEFNLSKISSAIKKAFDSQNKEYNDDVIDMISLKVTSDFSNKIKEGKVNVEEIQDSVEKILQDAGFGDVAKSYILYRSHREKIRYMRTSSLNYKELVDSYVHANDWRVKENSTVTYSVGGLILSNSGAITANYWLTEIYDEEISKAHRNADIHIHDLSMLTGYCAGWSLKQLIKEGLGGIPGKITSAPAKHLATLCNQMVNFLGIMQNEWAGAQAFSSFDTYLAAFVKADNMEYGQVEKCIESFIYGVNTPSRWGCVDEDTEVLTVNGWKSRTQVHEGDYIYTWKDDTLNTAKVKKVISKKNESGKMHVYKSRNYIQQVTNYHRCLVRKFNKSIGSEIKTSEEIFKSKTPYYFPASFINSNNKGIKILDEEIMLAAMFYTDGSIDYRKEKVHHIRLHKSDIRYKDSGIEKVLHLFKYNKRVKKAGGFGSIMNIIDIKKESLAYIIDLVGCKSKIHDRFLHMNLRQSRIFLKTWALFDGDENKMKLQYDNKTIGDQLQQIAILAGWTSHLEYKNLPSGKKTNYVKIKQTSSIRPSERYEVDYDGIVWCPNTEDGTAIFRKDGCTFISGNTQAPFSNITLDWVVPEDLSELQAVVGGKEMPFKYKDCKKEMDMVNKAFIKVMLDGDADGRGFQYPIPTYSITKEFDWSETENNKLLFEMTSKYGTPYFSNYVNSDMKPSDTRSMCCRLRLDLRELRKKSGGFFGSGESTGSVGVVTINLPRISYLAKNEEEFFKRLDKMMDISARSLKVKRQTVSKLLEDGLYPYTKHYLGSFNNHFSTIATIGINEVCINAKWIRKDLTNKEAQEFSKKLLNHMRDRLSDYQEQYGDLYNIEAAPAESTCFRLAKFDKQKYPEIITAAKNPTDTPYYTNSSHLPVGYTEDIYSALDIQDDLQTLYTSGTVFHAFLGEKLPSWKSASDLVRKIAENYKLPYYTLSPVYSICSKHGYLSGDQKKCPICCGPTETYSRITGYYRPVQNWNDGKSQEFKDRKLYDIDHSILNVKVPISTESTDPVLNINPVVDTSKDLLLFTTKTCPNCSMVKMILGKTDLQYDVIDAEEKTDLSIKFGIKQVPVLVVLENGIIKKKYENVSEIKKFVKG